MVEAIHTAVAGRARYRVPGLYRSESMKQLLEFQLGRKKDITHVSASALTGNVLVCFNSENSPETIADLIAGIVTLHNNNHSQPALEDLPLAPAGWLEAMPDLTPAYDRLKKLLYATEVQPREPWHLLDVEDVLARW